MWSELLIALPPLTQPFINIAQHQKAAAVTVAPLDLGFFSSCPLTKKHNICNVLRIQVTQLGRVRNCVTR